jgi:DNA-binding response OmpR family regulator
MPAVTTPIQVLLVEDNPTDAEPCIRAIKKMNLANNLVWVKDGAEALDFLFERGAFAAEGTNRGPKVVLLDLRLPKMDGLEVLRQARANDRTKTVLFIVLTSSSEVRDVIEAYNLGANSYISKPVEFDAFAGSVAKLGFYWLLMNLPPPETKSVQ